MSEFQQEEQQETDDSIFRSELEDAGVKSQVVSKLLRIKNDTASKLYSKEIEAARKIKVSTAGEISTHFIGQEIAGREAIRRMMFVALINGVLRPDTPFRRLWYQFIKASLQALATEFALSGAFYGGMTKMVKDTGLDYKDFGIINLGEKDEMTGKRQLARGLYEVKPEYQHVFPNVMLGIEDASYYSVFKNMASLLGLHRYSASGQSSLSSTEAITDDLKEQVEMRDGYPLHIRSITDYDPAGFNIANAYLDHFSRYLGNIITSKRFAPLMKHFTLDELVQNTLLVKLSTISQSVWDKERGNLEKYKEAYIQKVGVDFNESNDWYVKAQELLRSHGSIYEKGVRKGLGKAPKQSEWGKAPEELKNDILTFIDIKLPKKLVKWWTDIVKGGEEGARPQGLTNDPIDLFYFISRNEWIYPYGIELAATPETPLEPAYDDDGNRIYDYTDSRFIKGSHHKEGSGQARMRLLTFDEIVKEFGLNTPLKHFFETQKPDSDREARKFYSDETETGIGEIAELNYDTRMLLDEIDLTLNIWFEAYIEEEKEELKEKIEEWLSSTTNKYLNPDSDDYDKELADQEKKKIWEKLRKAVLDDSRYIWYSFPEKFDQTEYEYAEGYKIIIPEEIFEGLKPITNWAKCIKFNIETMKELLDNYDYNDLEQDWNDIIPNVFSCEIINGKTVKKEIETIKGDCREYQKQIRKLHDDIANLEWEYEKEIMEIEEEIGGEEYEKLAEERLKKISDLAEERQKKIDEWEDKYVKLNMKHRELQDVIDKQTVRLQELKKAEGKIEELQKQIEAKKEVVGDDCGIYQKQIRKLHDDIADYEREIIALTETPYRYWEASDIEDLKTFSRRIQLYYSQSHELSRTVRNLVQEKIEKIEKLYKKSYPKILQAIGQEKKDQMSLLLGDVNKINSDIKKLYYYDR